MCTAGWLAGVVVIWRIFRVSQRRTLLPNTARGDYRCWWMDAATCQDCASVSPKRLPCVHRSANLLLINSHLVRQHGQMGGPRSESF